jgi:hypothetical protein
MERLPRSELSDPLHDHVPAGLAARNDQLAGCNKRGHTLVGLRPRECSRLIGPEWKSLSLMSCLDANPEVRFAHKFYARSLERASDFLDRIEVGFNPAFKPLEPTNCHDCHTRLESKPILPPAEKRSRCLDLPHVNKHPEPPTSLPPKRRAAASQEVYDVSRKFPRVGFLKFSLSGPQDDTVCYKIRCVALL